MTAGSGNAFLVIRSLSDTEGISRVTATFQQLGIPYTVLGRCYQFRRTKTILFSVPHHRVIEAILALERRGYADVVAYQTIDRPQTDE